jgi:hypothetical protein
MLGFDIKDALPYLNPPWFYAEKDKFPVCNKLYAQICNSSPAKRRSVGREFIFLCRFTVLVWVFWIGCMLTLAMALLVVGAASWRTPKPWSEVLIQSPKLNVYQTLCVLGGILMVIGLAYHTVRAICNTKASNIKEAL